MNLALPELGSCKGDLNVPEERVSLLPAPLNRFGKSIKHGLNMTQVSLGDRLRLVYHGKPGGGLLGRPGGEVNGVGATAFGAAPFP